jgi:hypothetical protein
MIEPITIWTAVTALATVVYVIGTFLLWKSTKRVLVLNALLALRDNHFIQRPTQFLALARKAIPEIEEIMKQLNAERVDDVPVRRG